MNHSFVFLALSLSMGLGLRAEAGPACVPSSDPRTSVVYFGGYLSKDEQMNDWQAAANRDPARAKDFRFEAHGLSPAASNKEAVKAHSEQDIQRCADLINTDGFRGPIVLVGHSDGSHVVNEIVKRVYAKNKKKIELINLDGYASKGPEFNQVHVHCWTSFQAPKPMKDPISCDQIPAGSMTSIYTNQMRDCQGDCQAIGITNCQSPWCLHFSLANLLSGANGVNEKNWKTQGYERVQPPLQFLNQLTPTRPPTAAGAAQGKS